MKHRYIISAVVIFTLLIMTCSCSQSAQEQGTVSQNDPALWRIKATYNGEKTEGTEINGNSDITVTGYYDDGSTAEIDLGDCIFKNPGKLESGVVSTFELEYEGFSAEIYITGKKAPYTVLKMGSYLNKLKKRYPSTGNLICCENDSRGGIYTDTGGTDYHNAILITGTATDEKVLTYKDTELTVSYQYSQDKLYVCIMDSSVDAAMGESTAAERAISAALDIFDAGNSNLMSASRLNARCNNNLSDSYGMKYYKETVDGIEYEIFLPHPDNGYSYEVMIRIEDASLISLTGSEKIEI